MVGARWLGDVAQALPPVAACAALLLAGAGFASAQDLPANALPEVPWQPGPERYSVQVPGSDGGPTLSLYPGTGPVTVATGAYLRDRLQDPQDGGRRWHFIELYDHMCPHCWYAVPIISNVAAAFNGHPQWSMESLNCHMRANAEVCFFLEIISGAVDYPTFLLCPPQGVEEPRIDSLPHRAQRLLQHLVGEQRRDFQQLLRCRYRYREPQAPHGREDPFLSAKDVATWVKEVSKLEVVHPTALVRGADFTDIKQVSPRSPPGRPGWLSDDKAGSPGVPAWVPAQRWFDSLHGFITLIRQGYRPERHQQAIQAADFLSRAFPVKGQHLDELAMELRRSGPFDNPREFTNMLSSWSKRSMVTDMPDDDDAHGARFLTCDGTSCIIWTLLHVTLTAVASRGVSGRKLLNDESLATSGHFVTIHEALNFVRTFVDAFLNCRRCKDNFLADFDRGAYGRNEIQDYRDLPLWLWRMHNAVNLRVSMEQHAEVDRRWPMYADCPTCWKPGLALGYIQSRRLQAPMTWTKEEIDAPFVPVRVFWHMVRTFIGIQNVAFELSDLTPEEQEEVQAVQAREKRLASEAMMPPSKPKPKPAAPPGPQRPHIGHPPPVPVVPQRQQAQPSPAALTVGQYFGFMLLVAVISGVLLCFGCDPARMSQALGQLDPRPPIRSPVIRDPQEAGNRAANRGDEEDDLVEDGEQLKDTEGVLPEDPAAE